MDYLVDNFSFFNDDLNADLEKGETNLLRSFNILTKQFYY